VSRSDGLRVDPGRPRWAVWLAWTLFSLVLLGYVVGAWLQVLNGGVHSDLEASAPEGLIYVTFPVAGVVLATKRPRNPLGWLMLAIGAFFLSPGASYARYASITHDGGLPGAGLTLALHYPGWVAFIGLSGFLLMLFPDGHLPSPRWRWFAWMCGIGLALLYGLQLVLPHIGARYDLPDLENPLTVAAVGSGGDLAFLQAAVIFAPLTIVGGAVAMIRRLRRADDPVERQQLRWLAWAAGVIASLYTVAILVNPAGASEEWQNVAGIIASSSFALIPVTIMFAVLRYRLYDVDFVLRKTVVIAVVVAAIAVVYVAVVAGVGALVGVTASPLLSALAAAIVALVFQPLRARAHHLADRLVYGKRATPYEVMTTFGGQLAGTYSSDDVLPRLARVLGEGVGADRAVVWLRVGDGIRPVASWPADADLADTDDTDDTDDFRADVIHTGEELGALSVTMPPNDPIDPAKEKLVRDLAAQAGLVLSNVRLTEALKARLDDLKAAQKRLVAAQDHERRRLERNIHDGAQQQLVALAVKARLTRTLTERDPAKAAEMLTQIEAETHETLEDLRDLARGIYPPLLADKGLAAALAAQARKSPIPVAVEADGIDRLPQEVEAALYFSALEALQNTAKYAEATRATVSLSRSNGAVSFTVADDGSGFDSAATGYGTGLQGIADRLGALDGELQVASRPGAGTTVSGRVPVDGGPLRKVDA
jgi:signal transduction histidine kinase